MSAMTKKEWMEYLEKTWDAAQKEAWSEPQFECPRCGHCCQAEVNKEAVKLALEALESDPISHAGLVSRKQAITALRQALETVQEPVAWITDGGNGELWWYQSSKFDEEGNLIGPNPDDIPLYTTPPKREWVGLTDDEIQDLGYLSEKFDASNSEWFDRWGFSRAIEAKLREKNGG
jgi:hypothetical protein